MVNNEERIKLQPVGPGTQETYSNPPNYNPNVHWEHFIVFEKASFILSNDQLENIINAKQMEIKVIGKTYYVVFCCNQWNLDNMNRFYKEELELKN